MNINNTSNVSFFNKLINNFKLLPKEIKNIIICSILIILILNIYLFLRFMIISHTYDIRLNGNNYTTIYEGGEYKELGAFAINYKNKYIYDKVQIENNINVDKIGTYTITYYINSIWKKNKVTKTVEVLPNPLDNMIFELKGDTDVVVKLNDKYEDLGYTIESEYNDDFSKYVKITNNIKTNKVGEYEVNYTIKINKKEKVLTRNVYVTGDRYTIIYDKKFTNQNVNIKIYSNTNDFDYFDIGGKRIYDDITTLEANDNGVYSLNMVNKSKIDNIKFEITNIDREIPTGVCTSYKYKIDNKTIFDVNASDNNGVVKYLVNNKEYDKSYFTHDEFMDTSNVVIYDEAGNSNTINCDSYYGPDIKSSNVDIVKEYYGDTIKYWVERFKTYYITHIWVKDAYDQFKTGIKEPFPQLGLSTSIMNYVSKNNDYEDKVMIGSNASGIVSDSFNVETARVMPEWKYSSKSSVVLVNGEAKRNFTNINIPQISAITYGLKKNGYLDYYRLNNYNDITSNVLNYDRLISDGVKYTFAFSPVLIHKGIINTGLSNDNNIRQALGQKDLNNFIIITTSTENRSLGLSTKNLAILMNKLNCIEAFNLDGGGSTSLIYKDKDTNTSEALIYTSRFVPDIIYFVGE